jgi:hypothetical protein
MDQSAGPSLTRSRFVLLDRPLAHPGICKVCGASDRPVIDFGASDDSGAIYFCVHCLTEVAKGALNLVDASDLDKARLTIFNLTEKLNTQGGNLDEYVRNLDSLYNDFIRSVGNFSGLHDKKPEDLSDEGNRPGHGEVRSSDYSKQPNGEANSVEGPVSLSTDGGSGSAFDI